TNVSVGRGTDQPFHVLGAPFIDAKALLKSLRAAQLPGVEFERRDFTPGADPQRGKLCHGIAARVTDPRAFQPVRTGIELARDLWRPRPRQWQSEKLIRLIGNQAVVRSLFAGASTADLEASWRSELDAFIERRSRFLRYPDCSYFIPGTR
ncbi:MAG TPA: hypothetical protein VG963_27135, partial [Polyangiaceae bacterium]|nr:hypothetical protein [Polyangiaceae bacterium]